MRLVFMIGAIVLHALLYAQPKKPEQENFLFQFPQGQSMTYAMSIERKISITIRLDEQKYFTELSLKLRWILKMTPGAPYMSGFIPLKLECSNIEADWNISGQEEKIEVWLRGDKMQGNRNGSVFLDTENAIGLEIANQFKKELDALFLGGELLLDTKGNLVEAKGKDPFVKFWKEMEFENGVFGITFPGNPVPIGTSYTSKLMIKKIGEIILDGDGIEHSISYTRKPDEVKSKKKTKVFEIFPSSFQAKNLTAMILSSSTEAKVDIAFLERNIEGKIMFHAEKGQVIGSEIQITVTAYGKMNMEEFPVALDIKMTSSKKMEMQ